MELKDQQLKTILFIYRLLYQNLLVTANWKSIIDTQPKHNTKVSPQITRGQRGREEKTPTKTNPITKKKKAQTINKMAIRPYIPIVTLSINRLNAPTKRHRLTEWI